MRSFFLMIGALLNFGLMSMAAGFIVIILLVHHYSQDLPDYSALSTYNPPVVTRLYASDGRLLAEYATEKRIYVPLSAMPKRLINAFLAAEDKNFYRHTGIDIYGLGRAVVENSNRLAGWLLGHGENNAPMAGGSTITQQVVKNFLLSSEQTFTRKIKEALLAFKISRTYSKDRILELYLNQIYLGRESYGVAAASLNYFNKSMDELTTEEAALLAAMPKAPSNYNPVRFPERAQGRRNDIIDAMAAEGFIAPGEAARAKAAPIELRARDSAETARADFFAEEVRRMIAESYGSDTLYKGGLYVRTTLDPVMQEYSDQALRHALIDYDRRKGFWRGAVRSIAIDGNWQDDLKRISAETEAAVPRFDRQSLAVVLSTAKDRANVGLTDGSKGSIPFEEMRWARRERGGSPSRVADVVKPGDVVLVEQVSDKVKNNYRLLQIPAVNGAFIVIDPHTGRVLAMSGGYSYGKTEFNRATQAKRQPGSAFKPFVYLTALENEFTPSTLIEDAPVEIDQGTGMPIWNPKNYGGDFLGWVPLRMGLEKSRNAMTVRLAQMVGVEKVREVAKRFGVYAEPPPYFSMVLGASETTLLSLANAYAMVVNGGKRVKPSLIERIDDRNGKTIYRRDKRQCTLCHIPPTQQVLDPTPPQVPDNREEVVDPRVAYQLVSLMQGVVQRGTATKALAIGKPVAGKTGTTNDSNDVWFIGFSPDLVAGVYVGYDKPKSLGAKETGGSIAVPAFVEFMEHALKDAPDTPFRIPPGIELVKVDRYTGAPAYESGKGVILEAFKEGDNPGYNPYTGESGYGYAQDDYEYNQEQAAPATGWPPQIIPPQPVGQYQSTVRPLNAPPPVAAPAAIPPGTTPFHTPGQVVRIPATAPQPVAAPRSPPVAEYTTTRAPRPNLYIPQANQPVIAPSEREQRPYVPASEDSAASAPFIPPPGAPKPQDDYGTGGLY